jgi:ATP-binding cassette subfamily B protein
MVIISLLACFITLGSVHSELAIPLLGTLAIGAVRILPLMQQIFSSWSSIVTGLPSVNDAILLLEKPTLDRSFNSSKEIIFEKTIELRSVNFQYSFADRYAIKNASLSIKKGEIVGIMGPSGGGKSTILDILMALLLPSSGDLIIDDVVISEKNARLWQRNITHVPQHIYLSDSSILENIAIGVPVENIDINRVNEAVKNAQLAETIHMLSMGLNAKVGERGVLLSGGQRQRIGIARALYKNAKILILDEATSALDNKTESEFMSSLTSLRQHLTIIIVAHRLSTLSICDRIYEVACGEVSNSKNYHDIN